MIFKYLCMDDYGLCCILESELPFKELKSFVTNYERTPLPGYLSNPGWGGYSTVDEILSKNENWELTDEVIPYKGIYEGEDHDHGTITPFRFNFNRIVLVKEVEEVINRPSCICGESMKVVQYKSYNDSVNTFECRNPECDLDPNDFQPDHVEYLSE